MKQAGFELTRSNGKRGYRVVELRETKGLHYGAKELYCAAKGLCYDAKVRVVYGSPNASTMSRTCAGVYVRVLSEATSA